MTYGESGACPHTALPPAEKRAGKRGFKSGSERSDFRSYFSFPVNVERSPKHMRGLVRKERQQQTTSRVQLSPKIVTASCISPAALSGQPGTSLPRRTWFPSGTQRGTDVPGRTQPWAAPRDCPPGCWRRNHQLELVELRSLGRTREPWLHGDEEEPTELLIQIFLQIDIKPLLLLGFRLNKNNSFWWRNTLPYVPFSGLTRSAGCNEGNSAYNFFRGILVTLLTPSEAGEIPPGGSIFVEEHQAWVG